MVLTKEEIILQMLPDESKFISSVGGWSEREGLMPSLRDEGFRGALPSLRETLDRDEAELCGSIVDALKDRLVIENLDHSNIGDVSIDLRVGEDIFYSDVLHNSVAGVDGLLELERRGEIKRVEKNAEGSFLLEPDVLGRRVYFVPSLERFKLPSDLSLIIDAKSTTGRVFAMCNDRSREYIRDNTGKPQPVIVSVQPFAFPLVVRSGATSLYQATVRYSNSELMTPQEVKNDGDIVELYDRERKIDLREGERFRKDGLVITYDTALILRARKSGELGIKKPIDMDVKQALDGEDYFEIIYADGEFLLESMRSHLMATVEGISLRNACGHLSRETDDTGTGKYGHFAGKIQPGYSGKITMEVWSMVDRSIRRGDHAAQVQIDKMNRPLLDGEGYESSGFYKDQMRLAPQFPKMFKQLTV